MTTFVTAYFNVLPPDHPKAKERFEDYRNNAAHLLKHPMNLVFYGDAEMAAYVFKQRVAAGLADKTYIHIMTIPELPMFELQEKIHNLYIYGDSDSIFTRCQRFTPRYQMIILSKVQLLERAIIANPFGSTHYIWVDFGIYRHRHGYPHSYESLPTNLTELITKSFTSDTIRIAAVMPPSDCLGDVKKYNKEYRQAVAANLFGGSVAAISALVPKYKEELELVFSHNILPCEENIFGRLIMTYPKLFDVFVAKYTTVLANFAFQTLGIDYCLGLVSKFCFYDNNHAEYSNCLRIYEAVRAGRSNCSVDMVHLYNYLCISSFYIDRGLYDKYRLEALEYIKAHNLSPDARVIKNMGF
jgi:hypothetical protein